MNYDVVVVGAGPAGSTTTKFLSEKGVEVLLIDKKKFPRDKPCGGGLPYRVLNRFKYADDEDLIESYSYGGYAYTSTLDHKATIQKKIPFGAMIVRKKFDYGLAQLAVDSGADFIDGKTVKDFKISKDKIRVILDDKTEVFSDIVVGADGILSITAKKMGLASIKRKIGTCIFQEYILDEEIIEKFFGKERMCHFHVGFQGFPGYGWVFPKKQHLNIGIVKLIPDTYVSIPKMNLLEIYNDYFNILKKTKIIPENLKTRDCKGGILPLAPLEKTYSNRVVLVGDAAGLVNPTTGEGIYYAMCSGEIAAETISESLEKSDTSEKFLSKYQKNWQKDFGKNIKILMKTTKNIRKQTDKFIKLAIEDEKLADIALSIIHGSININEYRWKLISRYLYVSFKDLFRIKKY